MSYKIRFWCSNPHLILMIDKNKRFGGFNVNKDIFCFDK